MQPRQALNLLDQVAARFDGKREDHVQLQNAVMALNGLVLKHEAETKEQISPNEPSAEPQNDEGAEAKAKAEKAKAEKTEEK